MPENIYINYRSPEIRGLLHSTAPKGFARAKNDVVDVWIKPIQILDNLSVQAKNRNRATQFTKNDHSVEILSDNHDGWVLVRLCDKTIGWVLLENLERVDHPTHPHEILLTSREFTERYLGAPYMRGGTTIGGIDCSGLTQRYYSQICGVTIPRHSTDQWKAGEQITDSTREEGDLLNLRHREGTTDHVAIYFNDNEVMHACLDRHGVVVESMEDILKRYDILGTTRI